MLTIVNEPKLTSPLIYFGNRNHGGQSQEDLFALILAKVKQQGKFQCCYDLFAGSASFSLEAMRLDIADSYVINDLYSPLKTFWECVAHKELSELLIQRYTEIASAYEKIASQEKENFYAQVQKQFNIDASNPIDASARLAFLINYAENGMPNFIFDSKTSRQLLACKPAQTPPPEVAPEEFVLRVRQLNQFFQTKKVVFNDKDFVSFKNSFTADDFVYLEPPYPDLEDQQEKPEGFIYMRQQTKSQLQLDLLNYLHHLEKQGAAFFMLYGVLGLNNQHPIAWPQGHVFRLAGHPKFIFNEYVEHLYLSQDLIHIFLSNPQYQGKIQPLVHRIFETQAIHNAKNIALNSQEQTCTYTELNQSANRLARCLLAHGLETDLNLKQNTESLVALYLDRGPQLIISLLAILKSGAAFMPLDTNASRLSISAAYERIQKSQSRYVITHPNMAKQLKQEAEKRQEKLTVTFVEINPEDLWCEQLSTPSNSEIPDQKQEIQTQSAWASDNLNRNILPDNLAYVMYTSGSTGEPKGVEILHRGLPYAVLSHQDLLNLNPNDKISQFGSVGFDASLMEIFMTLIAGAELHLVDEVTFADTEKLGQLYKKHEITVAIQTPKKLEGLKPSEFPHLRAVLIVGDKFTEEFALSWRDGCTTQPKRDVVNGYGLTETTICSTLDLCEENKIFSIGKPILGLTTKLIPLNKNEKVKELFLERNPSANLEECSELYFSGPCLARGYWQQAFLTKERFQKLDPHSDTIWYKTGDVVKALLDDRLLYIGRCDRQIKLRGQRLELDEIENHLRLCKNVIDVRVVPFMDEKTGKPKSLAAYVEVSNPNLITEHGKIPQEKPLAFIKTLRNQLKEKMPGFMCPALTNFLLVDKLPLKSNDKGSYDDKTMKQAWPLPCIKLSSTANLSLQNSEDIKTMEQVKNILLQVLNIKHQDDITDESDFYDLSGDSLLINLFLSRLKQFEFANKEFSRLIKELDVSGFNQEPTLKGLWQWFEQKQSQNRKHKQKFESKLTSLPLSQALFAKETSLIKNEFHLKISMPFFVVPSLLGNPQLDYRNSVLQKLPCYLNDLNPPECSATQAEEVFKKPEGYLQHLLNQYQQTLQKIEGKGPYWLLGWSTGGWLALALARHLRQQGHRSFVFMLDTQHPLLFQNLNPSQWQAQLLKLVKKIIKGASAVLQVQGLALKPNDLEELTKQLQNSNEQAEQITLLFQWLRSHLNNQKTLYQNSPQKNLNALQQLINHAQALFSLEYHLSLTSSQQILDSILDDDTFLISVDKSEQLWGKQLGWQVNTHHHRSISNTSHFKLISECDELVTTIKNHLAKQLASTIMPYYQGVEALVTNNPAKAIKFFNQTLSENSTNELAYINLGFAKTALGQLEASIQDYDKAIDLNPKLEIGYINRGYARLILKQYKEALEDFNQAIRNNPQSGEAYFKRGIAKHLLGQNHAAIQDLEQAIILNPIKMESVYLNCGNVRRDLGEYAKSIQDYDEAIKLNKNYGFAYVNRGIVKLLLNSYHDAIDDFDHALIIDTKDEIAYFNRGLAKLKLVLFQSATDDFNQVLIINPNHKEAKLKLAELSEKKGFQIGLYTRATDNLTQLLIINPNHKEAKLKLTDLSEKGFNPNKLMPPSPINWEIYFNRGLLKAHLNQPKAAIHYFNEAIHLNPNDDNTYVNRGAAKANLGDYSAAIQDYDQALHLNPKNELAVFNRGNAKFELGDYPAAIQDLKFALTINPNNSLAHYYLGDSYKTLGQKAEETNSFEYALLYYQKSLFHFNATLKINPNHKKTQKEKKSILETIQQLEKGKTTQPTIVLEKGSPSSKNHLPTTQSSLQSNYSQHGLFGQSQETAQTKKKKKKKKKTSKQNLESATMPNNTK